MKRIYFSLISVMLSMTFTATPVRAELNLSDSPMFVTDVLLPNVVISPAYWWSMGESALKDVPWTDPLQSPTLKKQAWSSSALSPGTSAFRVTPWPKSNLSVKNAIPQPTGCVNATNVASYLCSQASVYSQDQWTTGSSSRNDAIGYSITNGSYMNTCSNKSTGACYLQEIYPVGSSDPTSDPRYVEAKSRYFHSDSNFLYFNPAIADSYTPWPSLGGPAFLSYGIGDSAASAYYSPLNDYSNSAGTVLLNSPLVDNTMMGDTSTGLKYSHMAYLGQYWVKAPGAQVITASSYTGTCWDLNATTTNIGCSSAMTDQQKQQFASWFTYWRSSDYATRGMLGNLFDGLNTSGVLNKFRFAFNLTDANNRVQIVGFYSVPGSSGSDSTTQTNNFLATIRNTIYSSQTSFAKSWNPSGTNYYLSQDAAYRDVTGQPLRSCRRNYEVILTPDYTGLSWVPAGIPGGSSYILPATSQLPRTVDDFPDQLAYTDSSGVQFSVPYPDMNSIPYTWGQVGAEGWITDLRPDLPDTLLPGQQDPATWQHVVRYIVGPNSDGGILFPQLIPTQSSPNPILDYNTATTIAAAATKNNSWPKLWTVSDLTDVFGSAEPNMSVDRDARNTYDDLWHMALNSHGYFYPSDNVSLAVTNLLNAFSDVLVRNVSGSAVATNTSSLKQGGMIYQATVESDWKGHLRAYSITPSTNAQNQAILSINYGSPSWDLAEQVSAQASGNRIIASYNGTIGVPFRWANIGTTAQALLETAPPANVADLDTYGSSVLDYLRGSGTCEVGSATICSAPVVYSFRRRNLNATITTPYAAASNPNGRNVLGDIDNSNPWFVPPPVAGRSDLDYPGYNAFRIARKNRPNVIYVGANDGLLHAVNTSASSIHGMATNAGSELFAYAPSFVQSNLYQLASPSYSHLFFVDGSPFAADIDVSGNGTWQTVLAGGANKGGKGYYLLDVTDPANNTEANPSSWVLWEFNSTNAPDASLNYTFNLPTADGYGQARQIVRMNDGKAALIVGNGYPTDSNRQACLLVIYLSGPTGTGNSWVLNTDYHKICVGSTDYSPTGTNDLGINTNGLSTPTPFDTNGDGKADVIYAGDLNGNMWRFDVSSADPTQWSGSLLFTAKSSTARQPIVSPPEVMSYALSASSGQVKGQLLLFGTGKYIEPNDRTDTNTQSYYGVWDRGLTGITRTNLHAQVLNSSATSGQYTTRQQTTLTPVNYCTAASLAACSGKQLGWYWDMPTSGERLTGKSNLVNGVILFNTFYPLTDTYTSNGQTITELDPCQYGGNGWLMALDAVNGYMNSFAVFDLNQDGVVNSSDTAAAGVQVGAAIGGTSFAQGVGNTKIGIYSPTDLGTNANQGNKMQVTISTGAGGSGRVSWYELLD